MPLFVNVSQVMSTTVQNSSENLSESRFSALLAGLRKESSMVAALLGRQLESSNLPGRKKGKRKKEMEGKGKEGKEMKEREGKDGKRKKEREGKEGKGMKEREGKDGKRKKERKQRVEH